MNKEEKDIELIEAFIEGRLSEQERKAVEERLELDLNFSQLYVDVMMLIEGIEYKYGKRYKNREASLEYLRKLEKGIDNQPKDIIPLKKINRVWKVAAVLLLLVSVMFIWRQKTSIPAQEVIAQNFEPFPNIDYRQVRDTVSNLDDVRKGFIQYQAKEYEKALYHWNKVQNPITIDTTDLLFYKSNALLASNEYEAAKINLEEYIKLDRKWKDEAYWYLFLAFYGMEDLQNSKRIGNIILDQNLPEEAKVRSILKN